MCHCCFQLPASDFHHSRLLIAYLMVFARCREGLEGMQAQDLSLAIRPLTLRLAYATMLMQFLYKSLQTKPTSKALSEVSIGFWMCHCCFQLPASDFHHSRLLIAYLMVIARCREGLEGTQAQDFSLAIWPVTHQLAYATMLMQFVNLSKQSPQAKPCQKYQLDSGCAIAVSSYQQVTFIILGF